MAMGIRYLTPEESFNEFFGLVGERDQFDDHVQRYWWWLDQQELDAWNGVPLPGRNEEEVASLEDYDF